MGSAPRRLDPRNLRATTPPLFEIVGIDEAGNEVIHPFPATKLWTDEQTERLNAAYHAQDEPAFRALFVEVMGPEVYADYKRAKGTMMMLAETFQAAVQEDGETNLGESSGSTVSSEASGANTSKQPSDESTASTSGETLTPIG